MEKYQRCRYEFYYENSLKFLVKQLTKESVSLIEGFEKEMKVMMTLRPHVSFHFISMTNVRQMW